MAACERQRPADGSPDGGWLSLLQVLPNTSVCSHGQHEEALHVKINGWATTLGQGSEVFTDDFFLLPYSPAYPTIDGSSALAIREGGSSTTSREWREALRKAT